MRARMRARDEAALRPSLSNRGDLIRELLG